MDNDQDEVIVDDVEEINEEVMEETEEKALKSEKPKRTPQEEYDYHKGRAERLAKKLGLKAEDKAELVKNTSTDKPNEFTDGQLAILRADGIKRRDEIALAQEYVNTGKTLLDVLENRHFLNDLKDLRDIRESSEAVPKGKGRPAQSGVNDVNLAVAKYKENGELPADFKTRNEVIDKLIEEERGLSAIYSQTKRK